jgi:hypothetical protein
MNKSFPPRLRSSIAAVQHRLDTTPVSGIAHVQATCMPGNGAGFGRHPDHAAGADAPIW